MLATAGYKSSAAGVWRGQHHDRNKNIVYKSHISPNEQGGLWLVQIFNPLDQREPVEAELHLELLKHLLLCLLLSFSNMESVFNSE